MRYIQMLKFFTKKKANKTCTRRAWMVMSNKTGHVIGKYKFLTEAEEVRMSLPLNDFIIVEVDA
jgi:hypothetical protein